MDALVSKISLSPPVNGHQSPVIHCQLHQAPVTGHPGMDKITGHFLPVTGHPVTGHPGNDKITGHLSRVLVSGHCDGLLVTPSITSTSVRSLCRIISDSYRATVTSTSVRSLCRIISDFTGQQLRVLVSGHCVALLVTPTGQQLRVLVSGHCVELLVTSLGNSYEY